MAPPARRTFTNRCLTAGGGGVEFDPVTGEPRELIAAPGCPRAMAAEKKPVGSLVNASAGVIVDADGNITGDGTEMPEKPARPTGRIIIRPGEIYQEP